MFGVDCSDFKKRTFHPLDIDDFGACDNFYEQIVLENIQMKELIHDLNLKVLIIIYIILFVLQIVNICYKNSPRE